MGQAKQRGSQAERIAQAKARVDAFKPEHIGCNNCQAHITDIQTMDTRGMPGIDAVFAGICPDCGQCTYAMHGDPDAVADLNEAMNAAMSHEGILDFQLLPKKGPMQ